MSLAGKQHLLKRIRSLFHKKEQAPSSISEHGTPRARPLSAEETRQMQIRLDRWVEGKGYRMADSTIEDCARRMGCHSVLLHRYCIHQLGMDFRTLRTHLRMEDAKVLLLQEPDTSASHIGRMVGIKDRSNFLRQFSRCVGVTPDEWRRQNGF